VGRSRVSQVDHSRGKRRKKRGGGGKRGESSGPIPCRGARSLPLGGFRRFYFDLQGKRKKGRKEGRGRGGDGVSRRMRFGGER